MNAPEVIDALKATYAAPAYALLEQVGDSTGFARRHIDAILMSLYPSRGLSLTGVEVKVSRNDWRMELRNPNKAEPIARYCDYFTVAAPKGIVPLDELPDNWGLIEILGAGKARTTKKPVRLQAEPLDRGFLAAVLRRASAVTPTTEMRAQARKEERERAEREIEDRVRSQTYSLNNQLETLRERVAAFEEKTGLPLERIPRSASYYGFPTGEDLAEAYLFLVGGGVKRLQIQLQNLDHLIKRLQEDRHLMGTLVDETDTLTEEV